MLSSRRTSWRVHLTISLSLDHVICGVGEPVPLHMRDTSLIVGNCVVMIAPGSGLVIFGGAVNVIQIYMKRL